MGFTETDKIGRKDIVDKICGLVDNLQKDKHFCLALNGEWGSGKTFVMEMIKEQLSQHKEYTVIKYDAWENSFYSEPLISVLSCIIEGLKEKLSTLRGYKKVFIETGKKVGENLLNKLSEKTGKIGTVATITKSIIDLLPTVNNALKIDGDNVTKEFVSYKTLLNEVKEKLNLITTYEEYEGKQNKLIILVDEIDRCLPEEQLKILERLHHLFDIKNCVVICAVNKGCIEKSFNKIYGCNGKEYLRKFFVYNYNLETNEYRFLQSLLTKELLAKLNNVNKNLIKNDVNILDNSFMVLQEYLEYRKSSNNPICVDNRSIENYFNAIENIGNGMGWELGNTSILFFIVVGVFIKRFIDNNFLEYDKDSQNPKTHIMDYIENVEHVYDTFYQQYFYNGKLATCNKAFDCILQLCFTNRQADIVVYERANNINLSQLKGLIIMYGGQDDTKRTNER